MDEITKICSKCKIDLHVDSFTKDKTKKDGLTSYCRACKSESDKNRWKENKDFLSVQNKRNYEENKDAYKKAQRKWYDANKIMVLAQSKKYQQEHKEQKSETSKRYYNKNKDKISEYRKKWYSGVGSGYFAKYIKSRSKIDVQFRISLTLRSRFRSAIINDCKQGSAIRDLGCSIDFLKAHLESQFTEGMTWENWGAGPGNWNIDHIMPMTSFDLTDRQHVVLACHYGNLQPLWFEDNIRKSDIIPTWKNYRTIHVYNKIAA